MERIAVNGNGMAAQFTQMLLDAGCDFRDERQQNFGVVGYNLARIIWNAHIGSVSTVENSFKVGRNDPCPCGSGLKYKKCCLEKVQDDEIVTENRSKISRFTSEMIPKLWNIQGLQVASERLAMLMRKAPPLADMKFSSEKVLDFLVKRGLGDANEISNEKIDELAFEYAKESGEGSVINDAEERMLVAAKAAKSAADIQALAAGYFFSISGETSKDDDTNLLIPILFRRAIGEITGPISFLERLSNKFKEAFVWRNKGRDDLLLEATRKFWDDLSEDDREYATKAVDRMFDKARNEVNAGKMPVGLPFASILPLLWIFKKTSGHVENARKRMVEKPDEFFLQDDWKLYLAILEDWLAKKDDDDEQAALVSVMTILVQSRAAVGMVPTLVRDTFHRSLSQYFLSGEQEIVESWGKELENLNDEALLKYSDFMDSKGYSQIAKRTRELVQCH